MSFKLRDIVLKMDSCSCGYLFLLSRLGWRWWKITSGVRVTRSLVFCMFCRSLFVLLYLFRLAIGIVLSVLLRYTDSDYPFGIFKLFSPTTFLPSICPMAIHNTVSKLIVLYPRKHKRFTSYSYTVKFKQISKLLG